MKYEAIVFDVTDTLAVFTSNWAKIYGDKLRNLGFLVTEEDAEKISDAVYWAYSEQKQKKQNGAICMSNSELERLRDRAALLHFSQDYTKQEYYLGEMSNMEVPKQKLSVIPCVYDVLNKLKGKYRLAIVSNHWKWLAQFLDDNNLSVYFETIIISEFVEVEKPDIKIMNIVLNELNLLPENCLYVGDNPIDDVLCSKQAGMDCAWIANKDRILPSSIQYSEDYRISSIEELPEILHSI